MHYVPTLSMLLLCSVCFCTTTYADDTPPNPIQKPGYTLDFSDEFNDSSLNTDKWTDYYLPHWCDDISAAKGNIRFENGCLIPYISETQKPWCPEHDGDIISSAIMSFDKSWIHNFSNTTDNHDRETWYGYKTQYGYFEIRAKLCNTDGGGHQAWWMVGLQQDTDNWFDSKETGEIDIIENFFYSPDTWRMAAYGWNDLDFQKYWQIDHCNIPYGNPCEEFHIYAMEWTPSNLKFYYDNQLINVIPDSPDYEMGTILNIYSNTGYEPVNDIWPKEWYIDYFRVWKPNNGYYLPRRNLYWLKNSASDTWLYYNPNTNRIEHTEKDVSQTGYAQWYLEYTSDEYACFKNYATNRYLSVDTRTGSITSVSQPMDTPSCQWKIFLEADGYSLSNRTGSDYLSLDSADSSLLTFTEICYPDQSQWSLVPVELKEDPLLITTPAKKEERNNET